MLCGELKGTCGGEPDRNPVRGSESDPSRVSPLPHRLGAGVWLYHVGNS